MRCHAKAFSQAHEFQSIQAVAGDPLADRFRRPNMINGVSAPISAAFEKFCKDLCERFIGCLCGSNAICVQLLQ